MRFKRQDDVSSDNHRYHWKHNQCSHFRIAVSLLTSFHTYNQKSRIYHLCMVLCYSLLQRHILPAGERWCCRPSCSWSKGAAGAFVVLRKNEELDGGRGRAGKKMCSREPEGVPWPDQHTLIKSNRSWSLQNATYGSSSGIRSSYPRNHITFTEFCEPITNDKAHWLCAICCD